MSLNLSVGEAKHQLQSRVWLRCCLELGTSLAGAVKCSLDTVSDEMSHHRRYKLGNFYYSNICGNYFANSWNVKGTCTNFFLYPSCNCIQFTKYKSFFTLVVFELYVSPLVQRSLRLQSHELLLRLLLWDQPCWCKYWSGSSLRWRSQYVTPQLGFQNKDWAC